MNARKAASLSPLEQRAYFALVRAGRKVASPQVVGELLGLTAIRSAKVLAALKAKGAALRLGRGKYALVSPEAMQGTGAFVQDPLAVAAEFLELEGQDYMAAYLTAAYLHGVLEQVPQTVQIMVTKQRRELRLSESQRVRFVAVLSRNFFGSQELRYGDRLVKASDLERTVLDCLDRLDLAGGLAQAVDILRAASDKLDGKKLFGYAKRLGSRSLQERLGYILERLGLLPDVANALSSLKHPVPCLLDPQGPRGGKVSDRWHLWVNAEVSR
jgi:predicted transcriptional regulator of viral defense system